jgi:mannose-6-phosphate isomerase-like protein (cupin superfamily)
METDHNDSVFDLAEVITRLPEQAQTMLVDEYLVDKPAASARIFRVYRELPIHYHNDCDEYLYILTGRARFHLSGNGYPAGPGIFLHFPKKTVHGFPRIDEHPFVVLAIDVPRRRPDDIVFVDPRAGDARSFLARNTDADSAGD